MLAAAARALGVEGGCEDEGGTAAAAPQALVSTVARVATAAAKAALGAPLGRCSSVRDCGCPARLAKGDAARVGLGCRRRREGAASRKGCCSIARYAVLEHPRQSVEHATHIKGTTKLAQLTQKRVCGRA